MLIREHGGVHVDIGESRKYPWAAYDAASQHAFVLRTSNMATPPRRNVLTNSTIGALTSITRHWRPCEWSSGCGVDSRRCDSIERPSRSPPATSETQESRSRHVGQTLPARWRRADDRTTIRARRQHGRRHHIMAMRPYSTLTVTTSR